MNADNCRINVPVQYFGCLGPWVVDMFKVFGMNDLDHTDFGPKHCQIIQDGNKADCEGSSIKVVTDGEVLVNAMFTLSSIHNFNQRFGTDSAWQKKVLMLEIFKVTHIESDNEFGDIMIKVEKFCCIGEAKYTADKFPFQLHWANMEPAVKEACQKIWENKLLDEASGTLEFIEDSQCGNATFKSAIGNSFLYDICSARNILIASKEERQTLSSLPGWSKENHRSTLKNSYTANKRLKSNNDVISEKVSPLSKCNQVKHSDNCVNEGTNKAEVVISPEDNQQNKTVCETKVQENTQDNCVTVGNGILQNNGTCSYSVMKENSEKEQQLPLPSESDINKDVSVDHQNMEKHELNDTQNNKTSLFLHKTIVHHKSDSLLNLVQDERPDSFCDDCKGRSECRHCDNNDLFHTLYCTQTAFIKKNSFGTRACCTADNTFTNEESNNINKTAISSRNKSKHDLNSSLNRISEQKMVDISDHSASKMNNVKRLKLAPSLVEQGFSDKNFISDISHSQIGNKTGCNSRPNICNVQSSDTSFSGAKKMERYLGNLNQDNLLVNKSSSSKTTVIEVGLGRSKPGYYQGSYHLRKAGLSYSVPAFDWSFSEDHVEKMWSKMVEFILKKTNQMQE